MFRQRIPARSAADGIGATPYRHLPWYSLYRKISFISIHAWQNRSRTTLYANTSTRVADYRRPLLDLNPWLNLVTALFQCIGCCTLMICLLLEAYLVTSLAKKIGVKQKAIPLLSRRIHKRSMFSMQRGKWVPPEVVERSD